MRHIIVSFLKSFPSDVFSFMAGAVFSIAVNLATQNYNSTGIQLWLIIDALFVSTIAFIIMGHAFKNAEEDAASDPDLLLGN